MVVPRGFSASAANSSQNPNREKDASLPLKDRVHRSVDGCFLMVSRRLAAEVRRRRQQSLRVVSAEVPIGHQPRHSSSDVGNVSIWLSRPVMKSNSTITWPLLAYASRSPGISA
jgi:hypothetical protein